MRITDFTFELPGSLIAHYPQTERGSCCLLSLDGPTDALTHGAFTDLLSELNPRDLLVFNNARVIPARLFGRKASGGKIEVLVERMLDDKHILAHIRISKAPKPGAELLLGDNESIKATIVARRDALFEVEFNDERSMLDILNAIGHMPLPPYIDRPDEDADRELYQAVYNEKPGAVAASTVGPHLDDPLLAKLCDKGIEVAFVTLHVGADTSQPVHADIIEDHIMHSEYTEVPQDVMDAVLAAEACDNRATVAGTTSVRSLESAAQAAKDDLIEPFFGDTQIFIYPGYKYQVIDTLATSSHLPGSMLIMLASVFAGYKDTMHAYHEVVRAEYRFLSYGDAMFITYNPQAISERVGK